MEGQYDFGMIGIGVMGSNLLLNMADHGYAVIGYDLKQERADKLEASATKGTAVKGTTDIAVMGSALKKPRKLMMLVPAGKPVDAVIETVLPYLENDDILIDGGNSYYKDTERRVRFLQDKGIHFFGMGISGGELGARLGPSMMPGGDKEAYEYLKPILEAVAAKANGEPCVAHMGRGAAGHYVKMVHNGIEYAMMQMISEVYDIMKRAAGFSNPAMQKVFEQWNKGQLQSYLIEITAEVFRTLDHESPTEDDYLVDSILDKAGSKGTGKWTSQDAMDIPVSIPTIDMAVAMRDLSVYKEERVRAEKLYQPQIGKIQIEPNKLTALLENALFLGFTLAYAQGLSLLAKASEGYEMNIPLRNVIQVWKAGCIIRSAILPSFQQAYAADDKLPNVLLDKTIAELVKEREADTRRVISLAIESRIPVVALSSALGYLDAYTSGRMPTNLIQAQRDFFGAHTYQRMDKEGVFHTEWHINQQHA